MRVRGDEMQPGAVLKVAAAQPDQDVVDTCRYLLERAESGDLRSITYAGSLTGGKFLTGFETDDMIEAVGLVAMMQHAMCASARENSEGVE